MPLISIIVPVYGIKEEYLRECIECLLNQTYTDIEIILVNDGTPDNGGEICEEYATLDKRIKVIHQENQGVSSARNNGIKISSGRYIMFVDADDKIDIETCEILKKQIDFNLNLDILLFALKTNVNGIDKDNPFWKEEDLNLSRESINELQIQILYKTVSAYSPPYNMIGVVACKLYRASFIRENGLEFDTNIVVSEDGIFAFKALEYAKRVGYLNEFLYYYRKHEDSATAKYRKNAIADYTNSLTAFKSVLVEHKKNGKYFDAYHHRAIRNIAAISDQYILNKKSNLNTNEGIGLTRHICSIDVYKNSFEILSVKDYFENSGFLQKIYFVLLKNKCYLTYYYVKKIIHTIRK